MLLALVQSVISECCKAQVLFMEYDEAAAPPGHHTLMSVLPASPVMTDNYIVFIEQPIKLDLMKFMLYKIQGKSFHKIMSWQPHYGTVFHLVSRSTGVVGRVLGYSSLLCKCAWLKRKIVSLSRTVCIFFPWFGFLKSHSSGKTFLTHTLSHLVFPISLLSMPQSISLLK